jgi:Tfp pilus assembly protein PilF
MTKRTTILVVLLTFFIGCASSQKKAEEARAKDPRYQFNLGLFYFNSNNLDEAVKYLNRCLSLDPRYYQAYNALGLVFSMKGNLPEAVKYYQRSLEISPEFSEAHNNLGIVYLELGYVDKGEAEFLKVLSDPAYPTKELPNYNLARLSCARKDFDKALVYVDTAIKLNNRLAMAHNLRGYILENQNKLTEAIESYRQAVKLVPEDVNFNFNLGVAYFKNSEWSKAAGIFQAIAPQITDPQMRESVNSYMKMIKEKGGLGS